ncbi:ComEC/Rec2 family competence protein, partial [Blastococcus atacamensis]|uniref:ComEC/Rec2 family competence protein n=1 Tax=Blastococcus atacamensis TaxID=2070508 RepID=UPI000CECA447
MRAPDPDELPDRRWRWLDLRLWPVAATVWALGLAAPHLAAPGLGGIAAGAAVLGVLAGRSSRQGAPVVVAVLAAVVAAAGTGAVRAAEREAAPLTDIAATRATVETWLAVTGVPHAVRGPGEPRVVLDAEIISPEHGGGAAVLLFAPADGWADLLPGQEVQARAGTALPEAGADAVAVLSARGPPGTVRPPPPEQRAAASVRTALRGAAARVLDDRPAGLLPGLVVGDTSAMDPVLDEEFRRAGLSHLTAVSGANVAIVIAGVLWPLRRRAVDRRVQAAAGILALAGFVLLVGPSASVVRAAAMGAVTLLALASGRARAALPALAAAVILLLLTDPALARDAGFALSVVATASIVLLAPGWARRLRRSGWAAWPADAVAVSAAAGLATAPVVAGLNGTVSLVSLPANLLAAPAVAPATVLGLLAAGAAVVVPPLGSVLVWLAGWPVRWVVLIAERASALPDAVAGWPVGVGGAIVLGALLAVVGWVLWRFARLRPLALAALVGLVVVGWPLRQPLDGWPVAGSVLVACDVGQGDVLVLPLGEGAGVLVDAGPEVGPVDACLDRLGIDELPLVLLSHLDADHVGGLAGALTGRTVGVVASGTLAPSDDRAGPVDALLRRAGEQREVLVPGDRRTVGGAVLEVLAPDPRRATAAAQANDLSMVVRATVRGLRLLLTGDLSAEVEARLVREGVDLRADVLKVPHHGSGDADPEFLAATGASVALVSVGADNTYGHPAPRLLDWLAEAGMRVHRTDREGDVAVVGEAGGWGVAARGRAPGATVGAQAPDGSLYTTAASDEEESK